MHDHNFNLLVQEFLQKLKNKEERIFRFFISCVQQRVRLWNDRNNSKFLCEKTIFLKVIYEAKNQPSLNR